MKRCRWVNLNNDLYVEYHDKEWAVPSHDDKYLFEMLLLESFQAGLSWECILNKREAFRIAFDNFDYCIISKYNDNKIKQLMNNQSIIRNKRKILSAINNAKIFIDIQKEFGSFDKYIWSFTNNKVVNSHDSSMTHSELSDKISKDLQRREMKFVGTVIIYSYLQAIGIINDHDKVCDIK